jgi:hypothetical protein
MRRMGSGWIHRVPGWLALLCLPLALAQLVALAEDSIVSPSPGRLVDIGGYRLHLLCTGKGSPTVVLLPGAGDPASVWSLVQPGVARFTRVCAYDPAGEAGSDRSPARDTLQQSVNELHRLLVNARIRGPYVLVGASWGGLIARVYTSQHPESVVGMVLVDSTHEDTFLDFKGKFVHPRSLSLEEGGQLKLDMDLVYDTREGRPYPLGDMPLIVLTRGTGGYGPEPGFSPEQLDDERKKLQADLVVLSRNSKQIVAVKSRHHIHRDDPALVINAIREVVNAARHHTTLAVIRRTACRS